jgi:PadR family transcriptional regulator, regulatory protein PadR
MSHACIHRLPMYSVDGMSEGSSRQMPGMPELVLLRLLEQHEMYGYEIARALTVGSRGALDLGEGVLYPTLHALEARGLLRSRSQRVDGRTRIYYAATPRGRRRLARLLENWRRVSAGVELILGTTSHE